jgi:hypothetical protein
VKRGFPILGLMAVMMLSACAKKESAEATNPSAQEAKPDAATTAASQSLGGPHALVHLKNGSRIPGSIVASSKTDMIVAGDDGIEHKIPLAQIKSVEYGEAPVTQAAKRLAPEAAPARKPTARDEVAHQPQPPAPVGQESPQPLEPATPAPVIPARRAVTTKTYELPIGSEISVRTNEAINSDTATEGQTFDVQVTRDATDANGDVVIPSGTRAFVVIKSASKGGSFRGASDLVLDLQSVSINGKQYTIDTADVTKKGKSGVGANKRTAGYTGGGAALGAIIGAIAGGGKGAAIGAGAGAGAGALTQVLTKGGSIKVPAESVLTFKLDKSLKVTASS